jgi:signal-transduction protein with cAMP-binding, CBS, and nucleotidyltransferase domain
MSPSDDASRAEEAARFLARFPPFQDQDPVELADLAANAAVRTFPSGTEILHKAGDPASHLLVIRRGVIELLDGDHVIDRLGEGEMFGVSVLSGLGPALSARARGETDCYLIDADHARSLIGTPAGLAAFAATLTRWRERDAVEQHVRHAGVDDDLVSAIGSAVDLPALVASSRQLPAMVRTLLGNGVDPVEIGHVVGTTIDHLTIRLIELFIDEQGEPPAAFAWVALGSAARHEQALTTDQDHAIAYGDGSDLETIEPFFEALASSVSDGLEACGIDRCRGNVMAVNPAWRRTREGWRHRFADYVADPNPMGARIAGIAFDYRRVTGAVDIEPVLDDVIRAARDDAGFLRRLGATVLESVPPTGRSRDIVVKRRGEHPGRVDIKHDGITIVTNLARISAILAGVTENSTAERLRSSASAGVLPVATRDDLLEAFGLLWGIRLEHHATRIERKEAPDDFVDPATLPPITSAALGGSFRAIAAAQAWLARELGLPHHRN